MLLWLVALLLLIVCGVQIVLWTDLPRGLVVAKVEQQLGLRLTVKTFSTGWLGHTQLNDVTVSLPLASKSFLSVPVMKVKNTSLIGLALGRPVEVQAIDLEQPHVFVWQDSSGRWNLQEVAELLARVGGKKPGAESAATSSSPALPKVHLAGGILSIVDNKDSKLDVQPVNVDGYPDTAVSWKYDVKIPPQVDITGRVAPGGNWGHELSIKLADLGQWMQPWMSEPPAITVDATWRGELTPGGITGRLQLNNAALGMKTGTIEAFGAVGAGYGGGTVTLRPDNLQLKTGQQVLPAVAVASGAISYLPNGSEIKVDNLLINAFGGPARVSASYNLGARSGSVNAAWEQLSLGKGITHSGKFDAELRQPFPNQILIKGLLNSRGATPSGPWVVNSTFNADGRSFSEFTWQIAIPQLQWQRPADSVNLDGLTLNGALGKNVLTVASIALPNPDLLHGSATYNLAGNQAWTAKLEGQHWPFHPIAGTEFGFDLQARGGIEPATVEGKVAPTKVVHLENLVLKSPDIRLSANGAYTSGVPKPLEVNVQLTNAPPTQAPAAVASTPQAKVLNGVIDGRASLTGTLDPLELDVRGHLDGREIDVRGRHLGALSLKVADHSRVDPDGVFIFTEAVQLLGGQWDLDSVYRYGDRSLTVNVGLDSVSLKDIATLAQQKELAGSLSGKLTVVMPGVSSDLNVIEIPPSKFVLKNVTAPQVSIEEVAATVSMSKGLVQLNPIHLRHEQGLGDLSVAMNLNQQRRIQASVAIVDWPVDPPGMPAQVEAWADIPDLLIELPDAKSIDPAGRVLRLTADAVNFRAVTTIKKQRLGLIEAHGGLLGRDFDLRAVHMDLLGGRLDGQAFASLDHPQKATAEFTWERLDLQKLALLFPLLKDLHGQMTGDLRLAPATVPRPREPLALVVTTQIKDGAWRQVPISDARVAAYLGPNVDAPELGWRVVMADNQVDPSFIHMDEGTVELWGRFGAHSRGTSTMGQLTFRDLNLDRLVHSLDPSAGPMPGRVAGTLMLIRAPAPPPTPPDIALYRMFPGPPAMPVPSATAPAADEPPLKSLIEPIYGEGRATLSHANLVNFSPFTFLYNTAKLFNDVRGNEGNGNIEFHLERGEFAIQRLRYFNRGSEIRAVATAKELWNIPYCPLDGTATLIGRPLKGLNLPGIEDFDTVLTAIQTSTGLTAVRLAGTLHAPQIIPLNLSDLGSEMQNFLVGDAKANAQP